MSDRERWTGQLLALAVVDFARTEKSSGINTLACRLIGEIALLTHHRSEAEQCRQWLRQAPTSLFLLGNRLELDPVSTCEARYPMWSNAQTRASLMAQNSPRYGRIATGEIYTLIQSDMDAYTREDTLLAIAIFGGLPEALMLADALLSDDTDRQSLVRFVVTCEAFFQNRDDILERTLDRYLQPGLSPWTYGQLALAIANRRPWGGYPFPDY